MADLLNKTALKYRLFLVILALGAGHFFAFCLLALPYRFFPSDDLAYYLHVLDGNEELPGLFSHSEAYNFNNYIHPLYAYYLFLCRLLWSCFAPVSPSVLIFSNLLANTVTMAMIVLICRRITGSLAWATGAGLVFAASAWTASYYFFFFSVPFPVALLLTAFTLLIYGSYSEKTTPPPLLFMTGGLLLALTFWSSHSAAVSVALVLTISPFIYGTQSKSRRHTILAGAWTAVGFILIFLPSSFISGPAYLSHLLDNVNTSAYQEAFNKSGDLLTSPPFSFFRMLFVYSPIKTLLFSTLVTVLLVSFISHRFKSDRGMRIGAFLAGFCLAHPLIIDLLPTTKLGRTHFFAFPFIIIFLAKAGHWVFNRISAGRPRKIASLAILLILVASLIFSVVQILKTRVTRFAVPDLLEKQAQLTQIYLLKEDPHAVFIRHWLNDPRISFIETKELNQIFGESAVEGHHGMVIIGPTGPGSGNSILQSASLADFNPLIPDRLAERFIYLPYYAYHPFFLFEEETCLALYFSQGKHIPTSLASKIKVFSW